MSSDPRTAIMNAAGEVFARYGFKKASVEDIARRAGVGKGSIYLHFESKEALFEACVRSANVRSTAELEAAVRRASTPELQVRAFIECKLEQMTRGMGEHRIMMEHLFELGAQAMRFVPELQEKEAAVLARVLTEGTSQGVFAVAAPQRVASGFMEMFMGLTIKFLTQGLEAPMKEALDAFFDVFIRGLAASREATRSRKH
ncbi:TetR/AcrR family transcriptional regulator [Pyxidicoccus parkwayensis]|uniref:TetR/AcrR family transcriptional regulator n=1 Tax=Pyxidicoccus parkwayensis TaxID=2813578 RepID=A0ABX7NPZ5_9BACT|nr:TetR/AcrR family transcriptional regulator [Pyxidicoccus parkwaysis]QSQ19471.1 TetR/AcrR family transcriptional regulator [Pyxidicoccus parkwaysis]